MNLPDSLWTEIKVRAKDISFGSITINLCEGNSTITISVRNDERIKFDAYGATSRG